MSSPNIPKIKRVPRFIAHIAKSINPIVEIVNRGLIVSTSSVIAEKQADGRIALRLAPQAVSGITAALSAVPSVLQAIYVAGTGYTAADALTATGGTFSAPFALTIDAVDGTGVPTSWHWGAGYIYTVEPINPVSFNGGTGSGAQFNLTWDS